ncbi:MAG: multidrug effflux MFS transporter [Pseudomonadota bacterium]
MLAPARTPPGTVTLICLTGVTTISLNMFLPSLVNIASDFDAEYALVSLSVAGYLAVTAVLQIIIGPLSDRYGRRPVLLGAVALFAVASLGCFLAQTIWQFLAFRLLQGAIIAGAALSRVIVHDVFPPGRAAAMLGHIAMVMAVAPMLGPMIGGFLDTLFGWRASFMTFVLMGGAMLVLVWRDVGETNAAPSNTFLTQARAYPALLRSVPFWGNAGCMAFSTGAFFAFVAGVPLVADVSFELSSGMLGIYMGSITGGFMLGSFGASRLAGRWPLARVMLAGRIVACLGLTCGLALIGAGYLHEFILFGSTIFVGMGNGITMPASSVGTMAVRPDLAGTASGLSGALTVAAGAVLTWIAGSVVTGANSAMALLVLMFATTALSLACALLVLTLERRAVRPEVP